MCLKDIPHTGIVSLVWLLQLPFPHHGGFLEERVMVLAPTDVIAVYCHSLPVQQILAAMGLYKVTMLS